MAERITIALVAGDRLPQLLLGHVGQHVDVEVLAQELDAGVGDLLLYEDPVAVRCSATAYAGCDGLAAGAGLEEDLLRGARRRRRG